GHADETAPHPVHRPARLRRGPGGSGVRLPRRGLARADHRPPHQRVRRRGAVGAGRRLRPGRPAVGGGGLGLRAAGRAGRRLPHPAEPRLRRGHRRARLLRRAVPLRGHDLLLLHLAAAAGWAHGHRLRPRL
ncbi:MAG: hypothetical protein AVDCRST_MAG48-1663, partial [uncultured Friedmanniella sp.]